MIELINLTVGYQKDNPIHKNLNYKFDNKVYGILGDSGCGKTTLLRTIAGLLKPINGKVLIDGEVLSKPWKNDVYMLHQNYTSFNWLTCIDNILISKKIKSHIIDKDIANAESMLKSVGLGDYRDKYPMELSGGQRQRLALARTIFVKPKIILMDEPLSALDNETRKAMQGLILQLHNDTGNTIIMVTHSPEEAKRMCSDILKF